MKQIAFILIFILFLFSCKETVVTPVSREKKEFFDTPKDSLYTLCKDLQGLDKLIIGKTTFSQFKRTYNEYLKRYRYVFNNKEFDKEWDEGHWAVTGDYWYDKRDWFNDNVKTIKVLNTSYPYNVGNLQLSYVNVAFLNDTLVAIYFRLTDSDDRDGVLYNHYIEKYGKGSGMLYYNKYDTILNRRGFDEYREIEEKKEERTWENEKVRLHFNMTYYYEDDPVIPLMKDNFTIKRDYWYLITSKQRYPAFQKEYKKYSDQFDAKAQKEKDERDRKNKAIIDNL